LDYLSIALNLGVSFRLVSTDSEHHRKFYGLVGKIAFRRVCPESIETVEALQKVKDPDVLADLHEWVTTKIE
jgi:hypothetical protein